MFDEIWHYNLRVLGALRVHIFKIHFLQLINCHGTLLTRLTSGLALPAFQNGVKGHARRIFLKQLFGIGLAMSMYNKWYGVDPVN